jgi:serine/threonine protein kinase
VPMPKTVTVRGHTFPVIGELGLGRKRFLVLEQFGARGRIKVFDPTAGMHGDCRVVHFLPRSPKNQQHVEVLRRLADKNFHFPRIVECHRQGNELAVVTAWIWGTSLADYLAEVRDKRRRRPSSRESVRLVTGLAHALGHLHVKTSVVHGDVKPANIVVDKDPTRLVLIDFGSAWPAERSKQKAAGDGISVPYAAPEQIVPDAAPDFRADYFSLSLVLYELLTLEIPYDGVGGQAGHPDNRAAFEKTYRPPSTLLGDRRRLPAGCRHALDQLLAKGLALDANARFPDRNEWLRSFDEVLYQFREGSRLGFFGRSLVNLLDWWAARRTRSRPRRE